MELSLRHILRSLVARSGGETPLGSGAIAGIVVGAVVGIAFVVFAIVIVLRRSKQRQTQSAARLDIPEHKTAYSGAPTITPDYFPLEAQQYISPTPQQPQQQSYHREQFGDSEAADIFVLSKH